MSFWDLDRQVTLISRLFPLIRGKYNFQIRWNLPDYGEFIFGLSIELLFSIPLSDLAKKAIVKTQTQPQHNLSWVRHENDFAYHPATPPHLLLTQNLFGVKFFGHGFFLDQQFLWHNFFITKTTLITTTTPTILMGFDTIEVHLLWG